MLAFLGTPLLCGFWLGQISSPQWNSQEIQRFIRKRTHCKVYPASKSMSNSGPSPIIQLSFVGDGKKTIYRKGIITNTFLNQSELDKLPISRDLRKAPDLVEIIKKGGSMGLPFFSIISIAAPGPTKLAIDYMLSSNKTNLQMATLVFVPIGALGYIGYQYGYKSEPDYASDLFVSILNNKSFWRSIESDVLQRGHSHKSRCI